MHVKYTDDSGAVQEWQFTPGRVRASEAQVIERVFGANWEEWTAGVQRGNMRARLVLLWHLFRRDGHQGLRFEAMPDIYADQLDVEYGTEELLAIKAAVEKADTLPAERRETMLAGIDREIAEAMQREGAAAEGKACSTSPSTSGGSSSPQN